MNRNLFTMAKATISDFIADRAMTRGAAIAYYTTFSLAPMLLMVTAIAGLVFGREAVQGALVGELGGLMGGQGAAALEKMIQSASDTGSGVLATIVSVFLLVFAATTVLAEVQDALNVIWNAPPPQTSGLWSWLRARLLSLALIGAVAFLLIVSLAVSAALTAFGRLIAGPQASALLQVLNVMVSFAVLTALFALIYKILPDRRIAWSDVWIGAAVTALLFTIGKFAIGLYLGTSDLASSYGAAGALILILLWVYYSAQIFLLGAEFTKVYTFSRGSQKIWMKEPQASENTRSHRTAVTCSPIFTPRPVESVRDLSQSGSVVQRGGSRSPRLRAASRPVARRTVCA